MTPIAILSHWHTASTLLAHTFRLCGMEVGNHRTLWHKKTCFQQCEHSKLNELGDQYLLGHISREYMIVEISRILIRYREESERLGWKYFGVKITHGVQSKTWPIYRALFDQLWHNVIYVTSIRDPEGIVYSTRNDAKWNQNRILDSILDSEEAVSWIEENGHPFYFPKDWRTMKVREKIQDIGLDWNDAALSYFDSKRVYECDRRGLYA